MAIRLFNVNLIDLRLFILTKSIKYQYFFVLISFDYIFLSGGHELSLLR